ncbi:MAG: glycosyltransferase family 9 protein [Chitinophagales bacterium]|nr:glycosyltransferase family 9 protein [Chitinophagales bacterium]
MKQANPKILIVRFSSIGDVVLTTPIVRCIKKQVPNVELHYLTKKAFAPILQANPYIDQVKILQPSLSRTVEDLRKEGYYKVIDLHNNQRTFMLKLMLNVATTSFPKLNFEKWLMVHFKINKLPQVHIVDRYFEAVSSLGVKNDNLGLEYFIPEQDRVRINELPPHFAKGYIAWAIGAQHATKRYPKEKIIEACLQLDKPILLLGGKEDTPIGDAIASAVGDKVYNACGKYSLHGSASLVQQAEKVVSNDTGLMHIAAAFQKPIVSLWGNTVPEFGMYPYYAYNEVPQGAKIFEVQGLDCRPCSKLGYPKCPRGHFLCMNGIDNGNLIAAIN